MKRVAQILCIVNLLALPALSAADDKNWYLGLHYAEITTDNPQQNVIHTQANTITPFPPEWKFKFGFAKLGYALNERFALETRYAISGSTVRGSRTATRDIFGTITSLPYDVELDDLVGFYGRFTFRHDKLFRPYLIGGYTRLKLNGSTVFPRETNVQQEDGTVAQTITFQRTPINRQDDGFSYGIGANFGLGKRVDLNLEYMNWHTPGALLQNSADYQGFNAGVAWKF